MTHPGGLSYLWRIPRAALGWWVYQPRVDAQGRVVSLKRFVGPLNQRLMEQGWTPPWIMTRAECHAYWSTRTNDDPHVGNRPETYAAASPKLAQFLHAFWTPEVQPTHQILELGCNSGVNLAGLYAQGYARLSGLEINPHAVEHLWRAFPDVARRTTISCGSVEALLPSMATGSVDVIVTVATLIHVHPSSSWVFQEIVRVAGKYLCLVEAEAANCSYLFSRNYQRVFERLGCRQVKSLLLTHACRPAVERRHDGYTVRLLATPSCHGQ